MLACSACKPLLLWLIRARMAVVLAADCAACCLELSSEPACSLTSTTESSGTCRLQSVIVGLDESNVTHYLRQLTDTYRLHLFDIVMQYRAIFSQPEPATPSAASGGSKSAETTSPRVLFSWAHHRIQFYVDRMQLLLPMCALRCVPSLVKTGFACSCLARRAVALLNDERLSA